MTFHRILGPDDNTRRADGKVGCDCTVRCGDDPWLPLGKSYPCEQRQRALDREAARQTAMAARMTAEELAQLLGVLFDPTPGARVRELLQAAEFGWRMGFDPNPAG